MSKPAFNIGNAQRRGSAGQGRQGQPAARRLNQEEAAQVEAEGVKSLVNLINALKGEDVIPLSGFDTMRSRQGYSTYPHYVLKNLRDVEPLSDQARQIYNARLQEYGDKPYSKGFAGVAINPGGDFKVDRAFTINDFKGDIAAQVAKAADEEAAVQALTNAVAAKVGEANVRKRLGITKDEEAVAAARAAIDPWLQAGATPQDIVNMINVQSRVGQGVATAAQQEANYLVQRALKSAVASGELMPGPKASPQLAELAAKVAGEAGVEYADMAAGPRRRDVIGTAAAGAGGSALTIAALNALLGGGDEPDYDALAAAAAASAATPVAY